MYLLRLGSVIRKYCDNIMENHFSAIRRKLVNQGLQKGRKIDLHYVLSGTPQLMLQKELKLMY